MPAQSGKRARYLLEQRVHANGGRGRTGVVRHACDRFSEWVVRAQRRQQSLVLSQNMIKVAEPFAEDAQFFAYRRESFAVRTRRLKRANPVQEVAHFLLDVPVLRDLAERLGKRNDARSGVANGHHANLTQLHSTVWLLCPTLTNPY